MKRKLFNILSLSVLLAILNQSCSSHSDHVHEGENITKVTVTFSLPGDPEPFSYSWVEGEPIPTIQLNQNLTYNCTLSFFNGAEDITSEIIAEKDEHFIVLQSPSGLTFVRTDGPATTRSDGKKLGINFQITTTSSPTTTQLNIKLYHLPTSVNDTEGGSASGGDIDVNITFPVTII